MLRLRAQFERLPLILGEWRYSRHPSSGDPTQGWKIHVSATILSASEVLARVIPILRRYDAFYKSPSRPELLVTLNSGLDGFSQVGKFLTIYPRSTDEAIRLAQDLHRVTRGLPGPAIPFDARYRNDSVVYYRYGAFRSDGNGHDTIRGPSGVRLRDRRAHGRAVPRWLEDPFQIVRQERPRPKGPIGLEILAYKAKMQRGKGGVYEALDLSVSPARRVILKEGRRHGETDLDGNDGYARLQHEARALRALRHSGVPVPQVFREFAQSGNRYLVLERLSGRPLLPLTRLQPKNPSWRRALRVLNQVEPLLSKMHTAGWVWRDCKPSHIFRRGDDCWFLDFELACKVDEQCANLWGSVDYRLPRGTETCRRKAGTREDDYALGVIAFQFLAGAFPPERRRQRQEIYRRTECPDSLRERIESLLQI